jgi:hypothetical protein
MSAHSNFPVLVAVLSTFLFGPPLVVALSLLALLFAWKGLFRNHTARAIFALLLTVVASIVLGLGAIAWAPPDLKVLGVKYVFLAGQYRAVSPLAFVAVAIVAPLVGWWAVRADRMRR